MTEVSDTRAILADYVWNGRPPENATPVFISYSFENSAPAYIPSDNNYSAEFRASFRPLDEAARNAARAAFGQWDAASGIRFFEVPSGMGGIKLSIFDLALRSYDFGGIAGVFDARFLPRGYAPKAGIVIDDGVPSDDTALYLHEIGHAIGLKHPFEGDYTLPAAIDNTGTTVMSYNGAGIWLAPLDRDAVVQRYGNGSTDGASLASWSWDAASFTLRQEGRDGAERLFGIGGNNIILGQGGDDVLEGADGADRLFGGAGADQLFGYEGNDHLYGQSANGGADGADTLAGGGGGDYLQGNAGADLLRGDDGSDRIVGGADSDTVEGGGGNDTVNGNLGDDSIDSGNGNDWLRGGQGNDRIAGGSGDDALFGDMGDDTLDGGGGTDFLTGGAGMDIYKAAFSDPFAGAAVPNQPIVTPTTTYVLDFADGQDRISFGVVLSGTVIRTSAQSASEAATIASQQLIATRNVAAITVGGDTLLFVGNGSSGVMGAITVRGTNAAMFDASDFA